MKKINVLQLSIVAMLLLCATFCKGQMQRDTVKVVLLASDTAHYYNEYMQLQTCEAVGCKDTAQIHQLVMSHHKIIKQDKGNYGQGEAYWTYGYSVRVKRSGGEMLNGNNCLNYPYYWVHLFYLDDKKKPLSSTVIVWQSVPAN